MVPASAAHWKTVEGDEASCVRTRYERATNDELFVAGELAPEGRLEIDIFTNANRADVGECCESTLHSLKPSTRRQTALLDARTAFRAAIDDIPRANGAGATLEHIRASRSLHALWELRNELFSLISCHHDQGEAARRIAALDRHFSRRLRRAASKRAALPAPR